MKITALDTGKLKLDGGAMFGVVPKTLWNKSYPADENNLVALCMRCLLIETDNRKILIDTGMGDKMDPKKAGYYFLKDIIHLPELLAQKNIKTEEITDVILTHLHFDHCGGAVKFNANQKPVPVFPKAKYYVGKAQWENAVKPNKREKASYFSENFMPLMEHNQLQLIDKNFTLIPGIDIRIYNGHTEGQLVTFIKQGGKTLVYVADLVPSATNIPLSWIAAYDMNPLTAMDEKSVFYDEAIKNNYYLVFEHDIYVECCTLKNTEKGVRADQLYKVSEIV